MQTGNLTPFTQAAQRSAQGFEGVLGAVREQIQIRQQARQMEREFDMRKDLITFQLEEQQRVTGPAQLAEAQLKQQQETLRMIENTRGNISNNLNTNFSNVRKHFAEHVLPLDYTIDDNTGQVVGRYLIGDDVFYRNEAQINATINKLAPFANFLDSFEKNRKDISTDMFGDLINLQMATDAYNSIKALGPGVLTLNSDGTQTRPNGDNIQILDGATMSAIRRGEGAFNIIQDPTTVRKRGEEDIDAIENAALMTGMLRASEGKLKFPRVALGQTLWDALPFASRDIDAINIKEMSVYDIYNFVADYKDRAPNRIKNDPNNPLTQFAEQFTSMYRHWVRTKGDTDLNSLYLNLNWNRGEEFFISRGSSQQQPSTLNISENYYQSYMR